MGRRAGFQRERGPAEVEPAPPKAARARAAGGDGLWEMVQQTAQFVQARARMRPDIGIVLGSGLGRLAEAVDARLAIEYRQVPHFPVSTVVGHSGRLLVGELGRRKVLVMQGRIHLYEGYPCSEVVFPVRVMRALGVHTLIVTNAAGGLNRHFEVGDFMVITDIINFMFQNPLEGANDERLGPRFPDMSEPFAPRLVRLARECARDLKIRLLDGTYMGVTGPSYETPAELRFMSRFADAVGMSTVPEVIAARHCGIREILGLTVITDKATGEAATKVTHEEVVEAAARAGPRFVDLLLEVVRRL